MNCDKNEVTSYTSSQLWKESRHSNFSIWIQSCRAQRKIETYLLFTITWNNYCFVCFLLGKPLIHVGNLLTCTSNTN